MKIVNYIFLKSLKVLQVESGEKYEGVIVSDDKNIRAITISRF